MEPWPNSPCPPDQPVGGTPDQPVGGTTVNDKLDEIINLAAQHPQDPEAQACSTKALKLKTFQPQDPVQGSKKVASATLKAADNKWDECRTELDGIN